MTGPEPLAFEVTCTSSKDGMFAAAGSPAVSNTGTLTFTLVPNMFGSAVCEVALRQQTEGGRAKSVSLTIIVTPGEIAAAVVAACWQWRQLQKQQQQRWQQHAAQCMECGTMLRFVTGVECGV
jgi:hypothetical protein